MAYRAQSLSVLAYANGFTLWHYATEDAIVTDPGYFQRAENLIRKGDMMLIHAKNASGNPITGMFVVQQDNTTLRTTSIVTKAL